MQMEDQDHHHDVETSTLEETSLSLSLVKPTKSSTNPFVDGNSLDEVMDEHGFMPLHRTLMFLDSLADALTIIDECPIALRHQSNEGSTLPIHIECSRQGRLPVLVKCIEYYPESLAVTDLNGCLPLHRLLRNGKTSVDAALMMIEKHPVALQHQDRFGFLPLHIECSMQYRSSVIAKCIEQYPVALAIINNYGYLPLHQTFTNLSSSVDVALMIIEKYPNALKHISGTTHKGLLPIHVECMMQCRPMILSKCIELYPESLDSSTIYVMIRNINKKNFHTYLPVLSTVFTICPMSFYNRHLYCEDDIRADPYCRRRILNLLPRHTFTSNHEVDYRDLNWRSRAAMMTLLSQTQIQQQSRNQGTSSNVVEILFKSLLA
jgi:hypothetical protein